VQFVIDLIFFQSLRRFLKGISSFANHRHIILMISFQEKQRNESDNRNNNNNSNIYAVQCTCTVRRDLCFSRFRHVFVIIVVHGCV